jgi:hypothetical protein
MLTGRRFRLERATLGVGTADGGKRRAVTVPSGAIITIASGPENGNGMVNVHWDGETLEMFLVDVNGRGTEITEPARTDRSKRLGA